MQVSTNHINMAKHKPLFKENVKSNDSQEEFDLENLGDSLIEGFKEIIAYKKGEIDLPDAMEYLTKIQKMQSASHDKCFIDDILEITEDFRKIDYQ
ncbi:MAG: hypothetical protein HQK64_12755, partial [Desulfamplus sp.]|nr:hypothetical protein [Desulfamplus sp.]